MRVSPWLPPGVTVQILSPLCSFRNNVNSSLTPVSVAPWVVTLYLVGLNLFMGFPLMYAG